MNRAFLFSIALLLQCSATVVEAGPFSTSIMRPTPVASNGVISGPLTASKSVYYFALDAKAGDLLTQLSIRGTQGAPKELQLELLDSNARAQDSYWVHGEDASSEATRSFSLDSTGKKILRVSTQGPETGGFCVLLGGEAFPTTGEQECWPSAETKERPQQQANASTTDLRRAKIDVVETKCEQRLRIGSDVLFDFDKAETRPEATATLNTAARYLQSSTHAVRVEGHTDGKGADGYNQTLSEKRAESVRHYLVQQGVDSTRITSMGFGKTKPVAPNAHQDGSDDPEGRQKNRRVEIVIDTCA
jgi:outer membrane protein OmpA-like peptidoglycan-associated protein